MRCISFCTSWSAATLLFRPTTWSPERHCLTQDVQAGTPLDLQSIKLLARRRINNIILRSGAHGSCLKEMGHEGGIAKAALSWQESGVNAEDPSTADSKGRHQEHSWTDAQGSIMSDGHVVVVQVLAYAGSMS